VNNAMSDLIRVENVSKIFTSRRSFKKQITVAVDDFNFRIIEEEPEIKVIAGESGSGKTTAARLMLALIKPTYGKIYFRDKDVWKLNKFEQREYRQNVQAVFQDPYASFNPLHSVEHVMKIPLKKFGIAKNDDEIKKKIEESLCEVGLNYDEIKGKYPHQLSGGQRQRIMIARAFILKPKLIIADEPVSMLDASIRANVLNIIKRLRDEWKISVVYITHDLSTAYYIGDEIKIMFKGRVVESGPTRQVLTKPLHPYTQLLLESIPIPDPEKRWRSSDKISISYEESTNKEISEGCRFYFRCKYRTEKCKKETPALREVDGRLVECFLY